MNGYMFIHGETKHLCIQCKTLHVHVVQGEVYLVQENKTLIIKSPLSSHMALSNSCISCTLFFSTISTQTSLVGSMSLSSHHTLIKWLCQFTATLTLPSYYLCREAEPFRFTFRMSVEPFHLPWCLTNKFAKSRRNHG